MEENTQHFGHIMLYYFKKGKNTTKKKKKRKRRRSCAVHGEGAVLTDPMCQKCFAKFRAGDFFAG